MEILFRNVDRTNLNELRKIAEIDVTIPRLFDSNFQVNEQTVMATIDLLQNKIKEDEFFELAMFKEEIVGYHVVKKISYTDGKIAGSVYSIWVDEKFRRKGIATKLKQHAEAWARENKLHHIATHVHKENAKMLALNEKQGFELAFYQLRKKL